MDWTLQKIELENFKFFKEPFELPVGGKHVLLYGENGSGKSSIVWGLYTLMESRKNRRLMFRSILIRQMTSI